MAKPWNKTLTRKLNILLLEGFGIALAIFSILFFFGSSFLDEYFITSDYIYKAEEKYIQKLSHFVKTQHIPATNATSLREWTVREKKITHLTIARDWNLIYDSSYSDSDTVSLGQSNSEIINYNWQYFRPVTFADGEADVFIYADYKSKLYILCGILSAFVSILIWLALFSTGLSKEIKYIRQLEQCVAQIKLGALDTEVPIKGEDELGRLAFGLNQMRLALLEKKENEQTMREAQDKLVLGMAHDLRTPLTSLMTYLEIAKKPKYHKDYIKYIKKAYDKTMQIRNLSNQLFDLFRATSSQQMIMEDAEDAEYALGEYLSELCFLLSMDGYETSIDLLHWEPVKIRICTDYAGRIMDNLASNIRKYGDASIPVSLSSKYSSSFLSVTIKNKVIEPNPYVEGAGIGIRNISSMMERMHGKCEADFLEDCYAITLSFPIISWE